MNVFTFPVLNTNQRFLFPGLQEMVFLMSMHTTTGACVEYSKQMLLNLKSRLTNMPSECISGAKNIMQKERSNFDVKNLTHSSYYDYCY